MEVITLTETPKKKVEGESSKEMIQSTTPAASTSKQENIVVTDIISENITKEYVVEKEEEGEDLDETMSISSTSTAELW